MRDRYASWTVIEGLDYTLMNLEIVGCSFEEGILSSGITPDVTLVAKKILEVIHEQRH